MENQNSKIIIGTAQFIKKYGINNKTSKNINKLKFLDHIYKFGCYGIDTALSYENAQKTIGVWIKKNNYNIRVYTKLPSIEENDSLEFLFQKCLKELNLKKIEGLFIHNQNDWRKKEVKTFASKILEKNLVNFFGLSVYDKSAIPINTNVKILQVPGNIFNQEILTSQELNLYIERGGEVHVRSVFVQGLILMKIENIPINLHELIGPIKLFHNIAKEANVDPISLAIQSVYKLCPQCKLVLGANNIKQLSKTLLKSSNLINDSIVEEVLNMGRKFSNKLWDPRNWK